MDAEISFSNPEIERLKSLGFRDWEIDANQVRTKDLSNKGKVSFPKVVYEKASLTRSDFWSWNRVKHLLDFMTPNGDKVLWEIGGGDGRVSIPLKELGINVISIEPIYEGCIKVAAVEIPVFEGTLEDLEVPSESLTSIGFFDVLEHIENEEIFLATVFAALKDKGHIYLTVPAHPWLFSEHDVALGHYRRYSKRYLISVLQNAGFTVVSSRFMFSFLVLPAFIMRALPYRFQVRHGNEKTIRKAEEVLKLPEWINVALRFVCRIERKINLWFGLSLIVVARKE